MTELTFHFLFLFRMLLFIEVFIVEVGAIYTLVFLVNPNESNGQWRSWQEAELVQQFTS